MSNNVTYSFVSEGQTDSSTLVFRSTVNSYGLNHVTDKDISSFYANFSALAYFDTGLLPVDGTGMLSIRSAGPHTQIAYQHAPGMYYINWGSYEGDPSAAKIYVAQPYRIVIADIYNNNLLGARTFYSPYPITHPDAQLYHVNLPNINCRGYRGNSVGWICLYHNEDISSYPFNEKVAKIIDRCSGTESYNDQNMSETDGPRFYQMHDKPQHLWDPQAWQDYSEQNGFAWTLDPDLWIPITVQDMDNQGKHVDDGEPLTFLMAIIGNYQCYYTDPIIPKPVNALTRSDINLPSGTIFNWFKQSYNTSTLSPHSLNPYIDSLKVRDANSLKTSTPIIFGGHDNDDEEEEDHDIVTCYRCEDTVHIDNIITVENDTLCCEHCVQNYYVWVEHLEQYIDQDNPYLAFSMFTDNHYLITSWPHYRTCSNCSKIHPYDPDQDYHAHQVNIWSYQISPETQIQLCSYCAKHYIENQNPNWIVHFTYNSCLNCSMYVPYDPNQSDDNYFDVHLYKEHNINKIHPACNNCYYHVLSATQTNLDYDYNHLHCICGKETTLSDMRPVNFFHTSFNSTSPVVPTLMQTKLFAGLDTYTPDEIETIIDNCYYHAGLKEAIDDAFLFHENPYEILAKVTHVCSSCDDHIADSHAKKEFLSKISTNLEYFSYHNELYNSIYGLTLCLVKS